MKKKILIITASYYSQIIKNLRVESENILKKNKIKFDIIDVPGVFEIPVTIAKNIKRYDGFVTLGCVIKGETPHFDFISQATFDGLMKLSIENKKPIGNGIITSLNKQQAIERSQGVKGKGKEATKAILSILSQK